MADVTQELAELLRETGMSHHEAFAETDGFDPEWALWYADHLIDQLRPLLGADLTKSDVVYLLVGLSCEHPTVAPGSPWHTFYARSLADRYGLA